MTPRVPPTVHPLVRPSLHPLLTCAGLSSETRLSPTNDTARAYCSPVATSVPPLVVTEVAPPPLPRVLPAERVAHHAPLACYLTDGLKSAGPVRTARITQHECPRSFVRGHWSAQQAEKEANMTHIGNPGSTAYSEDFYKEVGPGSRASAEIVVPLVMEVVRATSVIDVGCGNGEWLGVFKARGVAVLGVDGAYVDRSLLRIGAPEFVAADLTKPLPDLGRFDLCVSLEVAEHLPAKVAKAFVTSLTRLAPVVLFSAAVPNQGGVHHVNERWPRYWRELFGANGFICLDPFRPILWHNDAVQWWYRQNLFLCVEAGLADRECYAGLPKAGSLQLINERVLQEATSLKGSLKNLFKLLRRAGHSG